MDASGVPGVDRISVDRERPGRVGGRVEVTNAAGVGAVVCGETVTQEPRLRLAARMSIQIFFITGGLYFESVKAGLMDYTASTAVRKFRTPGYFSGFPKTSTK